MSTPAASLGSHPISGHRSILAVLTAILLLSSVLGVSTSETTLYGPVTYVRQAGNPITVTKTFRVGGPLATATLRVWNYGVSSAVIAVNNTEILTPNDFTGSQPNGFLIKRALTL